MNDTQDKTEKTETENPIINNKGFYIEDGGEFCRGCGYNKDGTIHDCVGRLFYFDPCPKCGRTEGKLDA